MKLLLLLITHELRTTARDPHVLTFVMLPILMSAATVLLLSFAAPLFDLDTGDIDQVELAFEGPAVIRDALVEQGVEVHDGSTQTLSISGPLVHLRAEVEEGVWTTELSHHSTMAGSAAMLEAVEDTLDTLREDRARTLAGEAYPSLEPLPVRIEQVDDDLSEEVRILWGALLMLGALGGITGAMYPAIDVVIGERDRDTLETTMLLPGSRGLVLLSKLASVAVAAAVQALTSALCVAVLGMAFLTAFGSELLAPPPFAPLAWLLALPGITAATLTACALILLAALPARTFATAEGTTTLAYMVGTFGVLHATMVMVDDTAVNYAIPLSGAISLALDALMGEVQASAALTVFALHSALLVVLMAGGAWYVRRESFLYGTSSSTGALDDPT